MMEKIASGSTLLNPIEVLKKAGVGFGQIVADLGVGGAGYFALQAAKMVGDRGRVFGVDVQKSCLSNLTSHAKIAGIHNLVPVWSNLEIFGAAKEIANASVDTALIINVLFQSQKRDKILAEAKRILKSDGVLVVIDWKKIGSPMGPTQKMRIGKEEIITLGKALGLEMDREFEPGEYHWGIIFKNP